MGKSKKPRQNSQNREDAPKSIKFELEENARDLLLEHLDRVKPEKKETDTEKRQAKARAPERVERSIDLHGFRLDEARTFLEAKIDLWLGESALVQIRIITGKGLHSQGGEGVLAREIHRFVLDRYSGRIQEIEASPDEVRLSGLPIRGHFRVTLRGHSS